MSMAYLDVAERFSPAPIGTIGALAAPAPVRDTVSAFDSREWQVIKLARNDRLSSLSEGSEAMEFIRLIFGFERGTPLSNPRLEALRRIAVMSWHYGYNVHPDEIDAFLTAGFTLDQYEALLVHIGTERAFSTRKARR